MSEIKRESLLKSLKLLLPGISKEGIVDQGTSFVFEGNKIRTYNENIAIQVYFESGLHGAVKAKEFYDLLSKMPDSLIDIETVDNQFIVKGEGRKAGIYIEADIILPSFSIGEVRFVVPSKLSEALSFCLFSVSKDLSIFYQSCLLVCKNKVVSFDSCRGTISFLEEEVNTPFLIRGEVAKELVKYGKLVEYSINNNFVHFKTEGNVIFSCRMVENEFPNNLEEEFFNIEGDLVDLPANLSEIMKRVKVLAGEDMDGDKVVNIILSENKLKAVGKGGSGWFEEEADIIYPDKNLNFWCSPLFLEEISKHSSKMIVGERLGFIGDNFKHVMILAE